jgi:Holliday junction resolvase RusA-like endonuclease
VSLELDMLENWERYLRVLRKWLLVIPVKPQAKQSVKTAFYDKAGLRLKTPHVYRDPVKMKYVANLRTIIKEQWKVPKLICPLRMTVIYSRKIAKSKVTSLEWFLDEARIDLDNLNKPLADAMQGLVFQDDSQLVEVRHRKIRVHQDSIFVLIEHVVPNRKI